MKPVTNRLLPVLQASMEIRTATKVNGWLYFIKKLPRRMNVEKVISDQMIVDYRKHANFSFRCGNESILKN